MQNMCYGICLRQQTMFAKHIWNTPILYLWYDQLRFVSLCEETCFEVVNPVNFVPGCGIARIAQNLHVLSVLYLNFTSTCYFGTISDSALTIREKPCTAVVFWIAARISCKEKGWRRGDSWPSCCQVSCAGTWLLYPTLCRDYLVQYLPSSWCST